MKKTNYIKRYKPMAIAVLFCAAAGVYANSPSYTVGDVTGDVNLPNTGSFTIGNVSGRVDVGVATGDGKVETANSLSVKDGKNVEIGETNELHLGKVNNVKAGTVVNGAYIDLAEGDVSFDNVGEVVIHEGYGRLDIKAATGNIRVAEEVDVLSVKAGKDIEIAESENVDLGTVNNVTANEIENGIYIDSANNVSLGTAGEVVVHNATGRVDIKKATADVRVVNAESLSVKSGQNIEIAGVVQQLHVGDVKDIVAEDVLTGAYINSANDVTIEDVGEFVAHKANNIILDDATGNIRVEEANSLLVYTAQGNVDVNNVTEYVGIAEAYGDVTVNKANIVAVESGKNVNVTETGSLYLGSAENVTVGLVKDEAKVNLNNGNLVVTDAVEGKLTVSGTGNVKVDNVGSLDANANFDKLEVQENFVKLEGDLNITGSGSTLTENGENISTPVNVATDLKVSSVNTANIDGYKGNVELTSSKDVTITNGITGDATIGLDNGTLNADSVSGKLTVSGAGAIQVESVGSLDVKDAENVTVAEQKVTFADNYSGEVTNVAESIAMTTVDGAKVNVADFAGSLDVNATAGNETIDINAKDADVKVSVGATTNLNVQDSKTVQVEGAEGATVAISTSNLDLVNKDETVTTTYQFKDADGNEITTGIDLNKSSVTTVVTDVEGNVTTGATINANLKGDEKSVTLDTLDKDTSLTFAGGDLTVDEAKGRLDIAEVKDVTVGSANSLSVKAGQNIELGEANQLHLGDVNNVVAGTVKGITGINSAKSLTIADAQGDVTVHSGLDFVDVGLSNDADLFVKGDVANQARVNGGCDATFESVGSLLVDNGLNGTITINGDVTGNGASADVVNVKNVNALVFTKENSNIAGNVDISGDTVITTNGATVAGDLKSDADLTLDGKTIAVKGNINVAGALSGTAVRGTVEKIYDDRYNLLKTDASSVSADTLVGKHNASDVVAGSLDLGNGDNSFATSQIEGEFLCEGGYVISKNSYFVDNAKTENEKALGEVLDSITMEGTDGNLTENDKAAGAMKNNYAQNGLTSAVPESVSDAVRNNMELADMIFMDTANRTSATRDMIKKIRFREEAVEDMTMVSVRNMNRVSSYATDSNASGSDSYVYGGLVNVEYVLNEDLFFGAGIGGFESKSHGRSSAGDSEAQTFALNLYGDYSFLQDFDWFFGATYAFNMNEAERLDSAGAIARQDWDSNVLGFFTGVRYTWKPFEDKEFYVKPVVGVNANFAMGEDSESRGTADTISTDIGDYTSVKSVVGVEFMYDFNPYNFNKSFYLTGRMLYTHEFADDSYDFDATFSNYGMFRVKGNEADRDAGIFGIGAGYHFNQNWSAYIDYSAEVSDNISHYINIGAQYKF